MVEGPPYSAYAAIMATFAGGLAATGVLGRALKRDPQCQTTLDFVVLSLASYKTARTLARDRVTSFLRDPFVEGRAGAEENEQPVKTGELDQAIGELVTCTRCVGTWAAAGLAATQIIAPRFGRILTWSLGAAAMNDFLHAGFTALTTRANELAEQGLPPADERRDTRAPRRSSSASE